MSWSSVKLSFTALLPAVLFGSFVACETPTVRNQNTTEPPKPVEAKQVFVEDDQSMIENFDRALGELEVIDEFAAQEEWSTVSEHHTVFRQSTRKLPRPKLTRPYISLALLDLFDLYDIKLEQAIANQNSEDVSFAADDSRIFR